MYVIATGQIYVATTIGTQCSLAGDIGGYLVKLDAATGACVWAVDTAYLPRVATDGAHIWAYATDDYPMQFDADTTLSPRGDQRAVFIVKYSFATGAGSWAETVGGFGSDRGYDVVMTTNGPVYTGMTTSETFEIGGESITNLNHLRKEDETGTLGESMGERIMFIAQLKKTDETPSCATASPALPALRAPRRTKPSPYRHRPELRPNDCGHVGQVHHFLPQRRDRHREHRL